MTTPITIDGPSTGDAGAAVQRYPLAKPVKFRGQIVTALTLEPMTIERAAAIMKANVKHRRLRPAVRAMVGIATECPPELVRRLSDVDLTGCAEWIADATRTQSGEAQ